MTFAQKLSESLYAFSFFAIGVPVFLVLCFFILCLFAYGLTRENFSFQELLYEFSLQFKDENGNIHFALKRVTKVYFVIIFILFIVSLF